MRLLVKGASVRAGKKYIRLPEEIVKNNPDIIVVIISYQGFINKIWVHNSFQGPLSPDQLIGLHVQELLTPSETEKVIDYLNRSLKNNNPVHGLIELNIDVINKRRKIRFLSYGKDSILGYPNLKRSSSRSLLQSRTRRSHTPASN